MQRPSFLPATNYLVDRRYADKEACLADLATRAALEAGVDRREVLQALHRREELGSTGVGGGVALPHARLRSITTPVVLVARLIKAIGYDAVDGLPVDVVCLLLLPEGPAGCELSLLARCARVLRDKSTTCAIRAATDPESLANAMKLLDVEPTAVPTGDPSPNA